MNWCWLCWLLHPTAPDRGTSAISSTAGPSSRGWSCLPLFRASNIAAAAAETETRTKEDSRQPLSSWDHHKHGPWQGCRRASAIPVLPFPAGVSEGTDWPGVIWALTNHPCLKAFTEVSAQLFCPDFHPQPSSGGDFKMIKKLLK